MKDQFRKQKRNYYIMRYKYQGVEEKLRLKMSLAESEDEAEQIWEQLQSVIQKRQNMTKPGCAANKAESRLTWDSHIKPVFTELYIKQTHRLNELYNQLHESLSPETKCEMRKQISALKKMRRMTTTYVCRDTGEVVKK